MKKTVYVLIHERDLDTTMCFESARQVITYVNEAIGEMIDKKVKTLDDVRELDFDCLKVEYYNQGS